MAISERDRISVDLCGLKTAVFERARALGLSPSGLVREVLTSALKDSVLTTPAQPKPGESIPSSDRLRVSLRMSRVHAQAVFDSARRAGLSPGDYVAGLLAGVPALTHGGSRTDHLAALIESNAELSTLARNIHHLTALLRQGAVRPAQEYREMLDALADDVRGHLELVGSVLTDLRPRGEASTARHRSAA